MDGDHADGLVPGAADTLRYGIDFILVWREFLGKVVVTDDITGDVFDGDVPVCVPVVIEEVDNHIFDVVRDGFFEKDFHYDMFWFVPALKMGGNGGKFGITGRGI